MYASLFDFVCIALLLPFVLGFSLFIFVFWFFFKIVLSTCYHWWIWFLVWLLSSFILCFLSFYYFSIFNNFFILITLFYFIYLFSFCFFLPFVLIHEADRVLVLQPGVRPEPLRWKSRVQDVGPPENSQKQVITNGESSPRDLHLNTKTQLHSTTSKLQCWTPYAKKTSKTGIQPHPLAERLPKVKISSQSPQNTLPDAILPTERQDSALFTRTQAPVPSTMKPTQPTKPNLATGGRQQNNRNYEPVVCEKETLNTVS